MPTLRYEETLLTPALAKDWLENKNYDDNRRRSKARVELYARQITEGRWKLNGEAIIFDREGYLLNGQHRCAAVVIAGKSIRVCVIHGVEPGAFTTLDQAYVRSAASVMSMRGLDNTSKRSSIARAMYCWETSDGESPFRGQRVTPDEVLLVQECYPEEIDDAVKFAVLCRREVPVGASIIGMAHILFRRARPRKAIGFLEVLRTGLTTEEGHPALVFRKRVMQDKIRDRRHPQASVWAMLIRAWNNYDAGKPMKNMAVKRNKNGDLITRPIRGLGNAKTRGKIK